MPGSLCFIHDLAVAALEKVGASTSYDVVASDIALRLAYKTDLLPSCFELYRVRVSILTNNAQERRLGEGHHGLKPVDNDRELHREVVEDARGGVFIAIGSNVGNRVEAIEDACREMNDDTDIEVLRTSNLYETEPMYVEDQARFLNGVCEVNTCFSPACTTCTT